MTRVMYDCHGNICRSPMAELIFRDLLAQKGLSHLFAVASSATSDEEIWNGVGNPVYPPAAACLASHGISSEGKRAVRLTRADGDRYDLFVCMDEANLRNAGSILGEAGRSKLRKLMDYTARGGDVADPWYTRRFDTAYADIYEGCVALLEQLTKDKNAR